MKKSLILPGLSMFAILTLLGLQVYWISSFYKTTQQIFEREVNMAYEDALKKEFQIRNDIIANRLTKKLLDTNYIEISSSIREQDSVVVYKIRSVKDLNDAFSSSFSLNHFNKSLDANRLQRDNETELSIKKQVVNRYVEMVKSEDLENHIIFFRSQYLGNFLDTLKKEEYFDTLKLRPVLDQYLAKKNIHIPYKFYSAKTDSTVYSSNFPEELKKEFPVITRSLPTYSEQAYVRVLFKNPASYIFNEMKILIICSFILVIVLTTCLYQLIKNLNREKRLSSIKNDFVSNITHEFKTPLATAVVAIESLKNDVFFEDNEKRMRYLNHAGQELQRINTLTDKILKLSLYENELQHFKKSNLNVDLLIREQLESLKTIYNDLGVNYINMNSSISIYADPIQMEHAISNILENSIKYGGLDVKIEIEINAENDYLVMTFSDNGPGIPAHDLAFIFDKFYRANSNSNIKGYGLGLNYVKQIMHNHKGWYKVASNEKGTTIILGWPI